MPRIMTVWLPRWPVQRRLLERPELRRVPVFVCRGERHGLLRVVSWAWAEAPRMAAGRSRARIPQGMPLAEGMGVLALAHGSRACHAVMVEHDDPQADRSGLEGLARWCRRFSPTVGVEVVEPPAAPECIHLDVTGTAGFFGGEQRLARTVVWTLAARGLHARVAIADTPGASWATAHHTDLLTGRAESSVPGGRRSSAPSSQERSSVSGLGTVSRLRSFSSLRSSSRLRWAVIPQGFAAALLAPLPVSALRLDEGTMAALAGLGIESLGDILRLSPRSLAARFPPQLSRRRAEFLGDLAEPVPAPADGELPQASQAFDFPLSLTETVGDTIAAVLERLVGQSVAPLAARGEGVLALQVRLERATVSRGVDAAPAVIDVGLFRPSTSVRHIVELVQLRLGRMRLPREIDGITVDVVSAATARCRQQLLFDGEAAERPPDVALLCDRLSGRLGRAAVFEPGLVADAQPEHAWLPRPPAASRADGGRPAPRAEPRWGRHAAAGLRPIWMPPRPVRLEPLWSTVAEAASRPLDDAAGPPSRFRWAGTMHEVSRSHGPERIETAWWRGPIVRRDYYVVETTTGARFWLFRRLRGGGWFLHGVFA